MFAFTHQLLSHHIATHVRKGMNYKFEKYTFAWANVKPDFIPSLAVKKHYIDESFPFVVDEIISIMKTPSKDLLNKNKKKIIEAKIGVICHFISDFFCVPHNQRWEFKHSMIPHVKYETRLDVITKGISEIPAMTLPKLSHYSSESVALFLRELLDEYEEKKDYQRDLLYAVNVCTAVSSFILHAILSDTQIEKPNLILTA